MTTATAPTSSMMIGRLCTAIIALVAVLSNAQDVCTPTLSEPLFLDPAGTVSLQQLKDTAQGTFTMRLTYQGPPSWIGVGVNLDGRPKMVPTQSVIGRVNPDDLEDSTVWKYRLASDDEDATGVIRLPDALQADMTSTLFTQDFEAQETVLEFTHPLADLGGDMVVSDDSFWVFAVGNPGNMWTGRHQIHGGFQLPLTDSCVVAAPAPEEGGAPTEEVPSASEGISLIGTEKEGESLYIAHGICMALAWGFLTPLAIGISFARQMSFLQANATWLKLHFYIMVSVVLLTTIGFALAVAAANKNGAETHFTDNTHTKAGLAIFLIVFVQGFTGYFRPSPPKAPKALDGEDPAMGATAHEITQSMHMPPSASMDSDSSPTEVVLKTADPLEQPTTESAVPPQKSTLRRSWEIGHRMLALVLVALAWYNCTSGIQLHASFFAEDVDSSSKLWNSVFWAVTASVSITFLIIGVLQRRKS